MVEKGKERKTQTQIYVHFSDLIVTLNAAYMNVSIDDMSSLLNIVARRTESCWFICLYYVKPNYIPSHTA